MRSMARSECRTSATIKETRTPLPQQLLITINLVRTSYCPFLTIYFAMIPSLAKLYLKAFVKYFDPIISKVCNDSSHHYTFNYLAYNHNIFIVNL